MQFAHQPTEERADGHARHEDARREGAPVDDHGEAKDEDEREQEGVRSEEDAGGLPREERLDDVVLIREHDRGELVVLGAPLAAAVVAAKAAHGDENLVGSIHGGVEIVHRVELCGRDDGRVRQGARGVAGGARDGVGGGGDDGRQQASCGARGGGAGGSGGSSGGGVLPGDRGSGGGGQRRRGACSRGGRGARGRDDGRHIVESGERRLERRAAKEERREEEGGRAEKGEEGGLKNLGAFDADSTHDASEVAADAARVQAAAEAVEARVAIVEEGAHEAAARADEQKDRELVRGKADGRRVAPYDEEPFVAHGVVAIPHGCEPFHGE